MQAKIWYYCNLMLRVGLIVALVLGVTSAVAVEHPVYRRYSRSHGANHIHVSTRPKVVVLNKGDTNTVRCRAKGGLHVEDTPFVTFFRRLNKKTVMPLSSSSYGVTIEAAAALKTNSRFQKSVKLLHLEKETYDVLDKGDNLFYCLGTRMDGANSLAYFIVRKV